MANTNPSLLFGANSFTNSKPIQQPTFKPLFVPAPNSMSTTTPQAVIKPLKTVKPPALDYSKPSGFELTPEQMNSVITKGGTIPMEKFGSEDFSSKDASRISGEYLRDEMNKKNGRELMFNVPKELGELATKRSIDDTADMVMAGTGGADMKVTSALQKGEVSVFKGFKDLTTNLLDRLVGKSTVAEGHIVSEINAIKGKIGMKTPEANMYQSALFDVAENGKVNVQKFADAVKTELLPITSKRVNVPAYGKSNNRYERVNLSDDLRGPVFDYHEKIYESPIKTSADIVHWPDKSDSYFAHTRVEDLPGELVSLKDESLYPNAKILRVEAADKAMGTPGTTRRVIEIQSDLMQKGRLDREADQWSIMEPNENRVMMDKRLGKQGSLDAIAKRESEVDKLRPFEQDWWKRITREEFKTAATDGKTKLQFPTGETAMKIEGLGASPENANWGLWDGDLLRPLEREDLSIGKIVQNRNEEEFVVTKVLPSGQFNATPVSAREDAIEKIKDMMGDTGEKLPTGKALEDLIQSEMDFFSETFDISQGIDNTNPIYKFYESDIGKFLQKQFGAKLVTDPQGVTWWEAAVDQTLKEKPVLNSGKIGLKTLVGGTASVLAANSLFTPSKAETIENPNAKNWNKEPVAKPLKILESKKDLYSTYHVLDTENKTEVREAPQRLKQTLDEAYKKNPDIPKGLLEAILMKESSMGALKTNKNSSIGEYAYLVGFTNIAKQDLIKNGIVPDLNTPAGVIQATADFINLKKNIKDSSGKIVHTYDNWTKFYNERFSSGKLKQEDIQKFDDMFKYYANQ